jgi:hypothetical protein
MRAILKTTILVPVRDGGKIVGERQGTINTIFEGTQTLDEVEAFLSSHKTTTTEITFESPIEPPKDKVIQ